MESSDSCGEMKVKFNVSLFYIYTATFIEVLFVHIAIYNV